MRGWRNDKPTVYIARSVLFALTFTSTHHRCGTRILNNSKPDVMTLSLYTTQRTGCTMAASGFELPFQWDDGTFVSPFVRSSGETLQDVGGFVATSLVKRIREWASLCSDSRIEVVVTDLGCGDGQALFDLCPKIADTLRRDLSATSLGHASAIPPVTVFGRGVDLDEELVTVANQRVSEEMNKAPTAAYTFEVADICAMTADSIVTPASGGDNVLRIHVVFVFLLTTALEQLEPLITTLLPEVEFFISNSWSVPYLENTTAARGKMGSCFVYRSDAHNVK